jgi:hypothetical protein
MPPYPPPDLQLLQNRRAANRKARLRMAQGLHPAAIAAREHVLRSQPMQRTSTQTPQFAPGDETVRLSSGNEVSRAVVDRVKERWQAALKMAQQMDAPPPGQPGGPPDPRRSIVRLPGGVPGTAPSPAAGPPVTPGLAKFLAQMAARRRR